MLPTRTPSSRTPSSRASSTPSRPRRHGATALITGAALGLAAIVGLTTSAAALDLETVEAVSSPSAPTARVDALAGITDEARTTLVAARAAEAAAEDVHADLVASGIDLDGPTAVDTRALAEDIERLATVDVVPLLLVPDLTDDALAETRQVSAQTAALRERLDVAKEKAAAAKAAAEKAAEKKRKAKAAAEALAAANTVDGAKASARRIAAADYGWGADQFSCLDSLWTKGSGWDYRAYNASSGATGIPQSLPGSKMATAGADWQTNAATQIRWGLDYISRAYGTPCSAWGHSQATNWY
jgi:hypothetical protein